MSKGRMNVCKKGSRLSGQITSKQVGFREVKNGNRKKARLRNWIVMWSYQDTVGYDSGKIEIQAPTRKAAEEKFKQNNQMRVDDKGQQNPRGGFTIEGVLTYDEWDKCGRPERL